MKKARILIVETVVLIVLLLGSVVFSSAQINKNTKIDNTKLNSKVITKTPVITQPIEMKNTIPYFSNIKPINLLPSTSKANIKNLKPVAKLPEQVFDIRPSSINGTMTARDPYLNSLAYIEFLNGDVLPGTNEVNCACGSGGLTYVKLVLNATVGKRYLVTTKVSPRSGRSAGLSMFSSGFVHTEGITRNNQDVSVVLSAQSSGVIELWMQCSDPNGAKRKWKFHSLKVEQVD